METAKRKTGRKLRYGGDGMATLVKHSRSLDEAVANACQLVIVEGDKKKPRPMQKAEFFREAVRVAVRAVGRGKFRPTRQGEREEEPPILEVKGPGGGDII